MGDQIPDRVSQIEQDIVSILSRVSERSIDPKPESELVADLGFDSVRFLELVAALEDHFNIYIPLDSIPKLKTVAQAVDAVSSLVKQQGRA